MFNAYLNEMKWLATFVALLAVSVCPLYAQESNPASCQWNSMARESARLTTEEGLAGANRAESVRSPADLRSNSGFTVMVWAKLKGRVDSFPAICANKLWGDGKTVDLISEHNMGVTLDSGNRKGWVLAVQPNGSWLWNIGNGQSRLDYLPTAERQPLNDGKWHMLAFSIDRKARTARLFYDGRNVAIYSINGFDDLSKGTNAWLGADRKGEHAPLSSITGSFCGARFFDKPLSDREILQLYQKRFPDSGIVLPEKPISEIKVLTWNIWHGARHPGTEKGIRQAVEFIKSTDADIVTMQETYGSGPLIADRLGFYFYLRSNNLSIMSRYPIEETHDLYQPFRFGGVTVRLSRSQRINVFSLWIHYLPDWRNETRSEQATTESTVAGEWKTRAAELKEILLQLKPFMDQSNDIPLIVGGDFNSPSALDWTKETANWHNELVVDWPVSRQMLDAGFTDSYRSVHTDPGKHVSHDLWKSGAREITNRIDYIYSHGDAITTNHSMMANTHNGTWPSDHPAVLSTLGLKQSPFGIISYNIWEGFKNKDNDQYLPGDERKRAVQDWLAKQAPDIVGFQELNGYSQDRLQKEAAAWGHSHAVTVKEGGYVVGLTSRTPIEVVERHLDGMHHGLLHCRTAGIDCFVVHLSPFSFRHRQKEAAMIIQRVQKAVQANRPVVVLGDFNAFSPLDRASYEGDGSLLKRMKSSEEKHSHVRNLNGGNFDYSVMQAFYDIGLVDLHDPLTGNDREPRIDFILASSGLAWRSYNNQRNATESHRKMSDHNPVSSKFNWRAK